MRRAASRVRAAVAACLLVCGCEWLPPDPLAKPITEMALVSNQENTAFEMRRIGDLPWREVGKGKHIRTPVVPGALYEVRATPDGYRPKTITLGEPINELRFTFMVEDKGGSVEVRGPIQVENTPDQSPVASPALPATVGARWGIVVGISQYRDTRIQGLRYARRDAEAFYDWLVSPSGGGFAPARVRKLLDEEATYQRLREALFDWSKQALAEDLLVIYLACHASPEAPDKLENIFLLAYDTSYDKISSTGFPMWDIRTALKQFVKARKVVVIADACHAGGIGEAFAVGTRDVGGIVRERVSQGIQELSKVNDGVAVLTASGANQLSRESQQWGGGHGVFTYFLLKGLSGEADYSKDSKVTLGELIQYVSENVRRETTNAQAPEVAGKFDPALSIGK